MGAGEKMQRVALAVVMGAAPALAACGRVPGPKGETGPPGPAGPQSPRGALGSKGDKGESGLSGSTVRAVQANGAVRYDTSGTLVSVFCPRGGAPDGGKSVTAPTVGLCLKK